MNKFLKNDESSDNTVIYGKNSVIEALMSGREFNKILISKDSRPDLKIEQIKELARNNNIIFQFTAKEKLNLLEPTGNHQGVVAFVSPVKYQDIDNFIEQHKNEYAPVIILDGIEDSHNIGAIIRSCVCAGIKGVILPSRRSVLINSTVEKTSAGAVNRIAIIKTNSLVNTIQKLKENNWWVIASDHHAKDNYYDIDYTNMNYAIIMGAEHSGISKSLLNLSDFKVKIPMLTDFNSLNVSNAVAVILFEAVRQRIVKHQVN